MKSGDVGQNGQLSLAGNLPFGAGPAFRFAIVMVALILLYVRLPSDFTTPQFWGEDGPVLYQQAVDLGWRTIFLLYSGYFTVLQRLIGIGASYFPPSMAPTIMNYSAFAITLFVVWLATSPRWDVPFRGLIALAVVVVPMGFEILGNATNTQWIAPVAAFILLFLRPAGRKYVLVGEIAFMAIVAFTGPCSIFIAPLCIVLVLTTHDEAARSRLLIFAAVFTTAFLIVSFEVIINRQEALYTSRVPAIAMPWHLWINLPFSKTAASFGPFVDGFFSGESGVAISVFAMALIAVFAFRQPYRSLKLSMLFFGGSLIVSGMIKYRTSLYLVSDPNSTRYFYPASVFLLWFICCAFRGRPAQVVCAAVVGVAEVVSVVVTLNTPRNLTDYEWKEWARYIPSGLPLNIPIPPKGWFVPTPAHGGPLAKFVPWIGDLLANRVAVRNDVDCKGTFEVAQTFDGVNDTKGLWIMKGSARISGSEKPFQLIAVADKQDRILGFGLPGFRSLDGHQKISWMGVFPANEPSLVKAYGVLEDGHSACLLAQLIPPLKPLPLTAGPFVAGVPLGAGAKVVQRFKQSRPILEAISVAAVTWKKPLSAYKLDWRVTALADGMRSEMGSGEVLTQGIKDWQILELPTPRRPAFKADEIEVEFSVKSDQVTTTPIGLPLYRPAAGEKLISSEVTGSSPVKDAVVGLHIRYQRQ